LIAEQEIADLVAVHRFIAAPAAEFPITVAAAAELFRRFGFSLPGNRGTPHDFQIRQ